MEGVTFLTNISCSELSDLDLIELIKNDSNNNPAFDELIKRYDSLLTGKANQFYSNNKMYFEFSDLKQEAIFAFFLSILSYDKNVGASFNTFASRCIENRLINMTNKEKAMLKNKVTNAELEFSSDDNDDSSYDYPDDTPTPEEIVSKNEQLETIFDIIATTFTDLEKEVLNLRLQKYSYKEIAQKLNIKVKDVDNIYMKLKNKIKNNM